MVLGSTSASYVRVLRMMSNARRLAGRMRNASSSRTLGKLDKTLTRAEERIGEALGGLTDAELSVLNGISYFADADCWVINSAEFRDLSLPIEKVEVIEDISGDDDNDMGEFFSRFNIERPVSKKPEIVKNSKLDALIRLNLDEDMF